MKKVFLLLGFFIIFFILNSQSVNAGPTVYYHVGSADMISPSTDLSISELDTFNMQCQGTDDGTDAGNNVVFNWSGYLEYNSTSTSFASIPISGGIDLEANGSNPDIVEAPTSPTTIDFPQHLITAYDADTYWVRCRVYDSNDFDNFTSVTKKITVLAAPIDNFPIVTLNSPANYENFSSTIDFNCTASDDINLINVSLYGNWSGWHLNETNDTGINDTNYIFSKTINEGTYVWNCQACDNKSQCNFSVANRTFTIDSTGPTITLPVYTNATPKKSSDSLTLNISVSDSGVGVDSCVVNIATATASNQTIPYSNGWCNGTYSLADTSEGNQTINAYANDTLNNWGLNDSYVVWIDNIGPSMSNQGSNETEINQNEYFCVNITATDTPSGVDTVYAEVYNTTDWLNYTMSDTGATSCDAGNNDGVYGVEIQGTYPGLWNYSKTYANDTLNNWNSSDFSDLTINVLDNIPPNINFTDPTPDNGSSTSNTSIEINVSIIESNLEQVIYNWNSTNYTIYDDNLVLMMNFDNVSALGENDTYVVDLSGKGNDGTVTSATFNSTGKYNGAFEFDGVNDFINISNSPTLNITENLTLAAWVRIDAFPTGNWEGKSIINKYSTVGERSYQLDVLRRGVDPFERTFRFLLSNGTVYPAILTTGDLGNGFLGSWHYVVGTISFNATGDNRAIYVDGVLNNTASSDITFIASSSLDLKIGSTNIGSQFFNGTIDEVRIWNRSLSSEEIQQLYFTNLYKYDTNKWALYVNQSKNATAGLDDGNYTYQAFASDTSSNWNQTEERTITIQAEADNEYPQFSNYWDDNASIVDNGTGNFNVTIASTNGTVLLEINNTNVTATNLTSDVYNASYYFSTNGTYTYRWHSWGNGTSENYNVSEDRSYSVNSSIENYYVDNLSIGGTCSDSNAGTNISEPWCTLNKAATTVTAGDTVYIRNATYLENINPANSGSAGNPITFKAYNNEIVILDGSAEITNWIQDSGNRYKANVTFTPDPTFDTAGYNCDNSDGGLVLQDGAKFNYCMAPDVGSVDSEGEYYMNDASGCSTGTPCTLYVYARDLGSGYNPNNYEIRVGKIRKLIDLDGGEDYISIDGLELRRAQDNNLHSIGSLNIEIRNSKFYSAYITGIYLTSTSDNASIENNTFWDNNHAGIELWASHNAIIRKNLLKRVDLGNGYGGNGAQIYIGGPGGFANNVTIENNIMWEVGSNYSNGAAIQVRGNNVKIRFNTAYRWGTGGMALIEGTDSEIRNNIFYEDTELIATINVFPSAVTSGGHVIEYNDFYATNKTGAYRWNAVSYDNLTAWETASGQSNNIDNNSLFVSTSSKDFHLQTGSPAIDSGINVNVYEDFNGTIRPIDGDNNGSAEFDIGAYEYNSSYQYTVVTLNSPSNGTLNSSTTINFNCSAVDNINLANITLYGNWSGWHANETKSVTGLSNSTNFTKTLSDGTYIWNCLAYDNDSNFDWGDSNYTLTIQVDTYYPQFSDFIESPANNSEYSFGQNYQFNSTVTTTNGTVYLSFDNTNYSASNISDEFYVDFNSLSEGTYNYYWFGYGNGTNKNYNQSSVRVYVVQKATDSCNVNFNETSGITYPATFKVWNNCTSGAVLYRNGTEIINNSEQSLSAGTWNFTVTRNDTANYSNIYDEQNFQVSQATPVLTKYLNSIDDNLSIVYPAQVNASASTIQGTVNIYRNGTQVTGENNVDVSLAASYYEYEFNVTGNQNYTDLTSVYLYAQVNKSADSCHVNFNESSGIIYPSTFKVWSNCTTSATLYRNSSSIGNNTNQSLAASTYNFTVIRADNENYTNYYDEKNFEVQKFTTSLSLNSIPSWTETYPTQTNITGSSCPIQLTCNLYREGIEINSENGQNVTLGFGVYNYTYNTTGNENYTAYTNTTNLTISQNTGACQVLFNESSGINYPATFKVWSDCNSDFTLYRNSSTIGNNSNQSLAASSYNFTVIRNDTANYSNYYDEKQFIVNQGIGEIATYIDETRGDKSVLFNTERFLNATLLNGQAGENITLYYNGTLIEQGPSPLSNLTNFSSIGVWNVSSFYDGNENYTADTETWWVTVSTDSAPTINIIYPENISYNFSVTQLNYTVDDDINVSHCWYSLDGGLINSTPSETCSNYTGLVSIEGSNNWTVYANDSTNQIGSDIVFFTKDTIYPIFSNYLRNPDPLNEDQDVQLNATITDNNTDTVILEWNGTTNYTVTTNNGDEYYFTILQGNYTAHDSVTYYWYANDTAGNLNKSTQQSFTVANQIPTITVNEPDGTNDNTKTNFTVTWTASDNDDEDSLTISCYGDADNSGYDKTYTCFTGTANDGSDSCDVSSWNEDTYYIWCNATDTYSSNVDYSPGELTVDKTGPSIGSETKDKTPNEDQNVQLNATITDTGVGLDTIWVNVSVNNSAETKFIVTTNYSADYYFTLDKTNYTAHDIVNWTYHANDTLDNLGSGTMQSFTVTNQIPTLSPVPLLNETSPKTNDILNCTGGTFQDDDADDNPQDTGWKWYKNDIEISGEISQTLDLSVAGNGNKGDVIKCSERVYDNYNWSNWYNSSNTATINNTAPTIDNPQTPVNKNADGTPYNYDYEATDPDVTDGVDTLTWYDNTTLFDIISGTGVISHTPNESEAGTYSILINVSDGTAQNTDEFTYTINDVTSPSINFQPPTETNGSQLTRDYIQVNVTASDINGIGTITLRLYNSSSLVQTNTSFTSPLFVNFTNLVDENYYFNATVNDTSGNTNQTETFTVSTDTGPPTINYVSPTQDPGAYKSQNYIEVNVTASDPNLDKIVIRLYNSAQTEINSATTSSSPNFANFTGLSNGLYYYNATANDTFGNSDSLTTSNITLDTVFPLIQFVSPTEDNSTTHSRDWIFVNVTVTEDNEDTITFSLYNQTSLVNETLYTDSTREINWTNLPNEIYYYNVTVNDTAGNSNNTVTNKIILDTEGPQVSSLTESPTDPADYSESGTYMFNATVTDPSLDLVWVDFNGTNYTATPLGSNIYNITLSNLGVGNYSYRWYANDSFSNLNDSENDTYTINQGTPSLGLTITPSDNETYPTQTTADGTGCPSQLTCNLYRDNIPVSKPEIITLAAGTYNYTYNTTGNANYTSASVSDNLTITQATGLVYTYLNNSRSNITIEQYTEIYLNSTLETGQAGESIKLYNNGSLINQGTSPLYNLTNFTTIYLYNITTIYDGNENYTSDTETWWVNVTELDVTPPQISIIYPENITYNEIQTQLNYTASDNFGLIDCWYSINGGQNETITCGQNITGLNSGQGSSTWTLWANDAKGNENSSSVTFFVDSINPTINFVTPTPESGLSTKENSVYVNVSTSDLNNHSAFIDWNYSLVGWWRFDNSSDLTDHSTYGNDGTNVNSTYTISGKRGGARDFDGDDDYVEVEDIGNFPAITLEAWIYRKVDSGIYERILSRDDAAGIQWTQYIQIKNTDILQFGVLLNTTNVVAESSTTIATDTWYHVVGVLNGTTAKLFINGVQDGEDTGEGSFELTPNKFYMGRLVSGGIWYYDFNGTIDEIRIHNRVLSPEEINASYNAGLYRLGNNFTNLNAGTYDYKAHTIDVGGNTNQTETRTIFLVLPNLTIIKPENETYITNISLPLNYIASYEDYVWYNIDQLGSNETITGNTTFNVSSQGSHILYLYANNTLGITSKNITFNIDSTKFIVKYNNYTGTEKGNSTEFNQSSFEDLQNLSEIILENTEYGKISFNETINMTDDSNISDNEIDLDSYTNLSQNHIEINITALPNLNKSATLYLYNLNFSNPRILRNNERCDSEICTKESYSPSTGTLQFTVTQFTTYKCRRNSC